MPERGRPAATHVRRAIAVLIAIAAALTIGNGLQLPGLVTTLIGLALIVLAILIADNVRPSPDNR
jgi:UPF0716 family protein affecting phage T7 exclusion